MLAAPLVEFARPDDAPAIAAMSRALIEYGLGWGWRAARVRRSIADVDTNVVVTRESGEVVAFGIMEYLDDTAHLVLFAVARDRQRRGVGTHLLEWLEASARVAGASSIRVESRRDNTAARSFYRSHGYREEDVRRGMYSGVVDGVLLQKRLRRDAATHDD